MAGKRTRDDQALLTLTERKTRFELMIKVDDKSAKPVNDALRSCLVSLILTQ
ncbi:hypothetical protein FD47_GL000309 [Lentilactobacillus parafarraginis DSM 18390 = JCM 14109]|uniref:Uncharacterized protein n=1 Tax=Lentilactobacillus parafarraginis DSM 18390 = JCM 14109 TaxID=1423786 RepID=A0A0R1Y6W5_9LACO|nr:hypothetical protein FD47_GL000309 [Lentilactobacillus parafarraginis DSM 18390 = JCM 14109]KRN75891.1 hypothetical protein IV42_GL000308 [Lentilactobacillus parabuchneri]